MSLEGIRDAIKTGLSGITGLIAYDTVPDIINTPCAFVVPTGGEYDFTASTSCMALRFEITLLVGRQGDIRESQDKIDAYLFPTGSNSIKAAIEGANFSTHADAVRVSGFRDYGGLEFGGQVYIGCKFDVQVWV